jgi:hypothetical protein
MHVVGVDAAQVTGTVTDAEERQCAWLDPTALPAPSDDLLEPGEYRLHVHGPDCAAQALPFTVRDGETTRVDVAAVPGTRQRLVLVRADGAGFEYGVLLRVRSGGSLVLPWVPRPSGGHPDAELWLVPGRYELQAECGKLRGQTSIAIGTSEGPVLRIELR